MSADVFIDTNIFLYAIDEDPASAEKRACAQHVLLNRSWSWSVQVAAEFFVNATSPKRPFRLSTADALKCVETWLTFPTLSITPDLFRKATRIAAEFGVTYWDAAILAAAKELGCATVFSEDLNHGQDYDGVTVVNPFLSQSTNSLLSS